MSGGVASALKWGFADFEDWNPVVDRQTLKPGDAVKLLELLRFRPIQFCMCLKAYLLEGAMISGRRFNVSP